MIVILGHIISLFQFRNDMFHRTDRTNHLQTLYRIGAHKNLVQFILFALCCDNLKTACVTQHPVVCRDVDVPLFTETAVKTYSTENAQWVVFIDNIWSRCHTQKFMSHIIGSVSARVVYTTGRYVTVQRIDSQITTHTVFNKSAVCSLRITALLVVVLLLACLDTFNLFVGKGG